MPPAIVYLLSAISIALAASLLLEPLGDRINVSRRLKSVAGLKGSAVSNPYETRPLGLVTSLKELVSGSVSIASRFSSASSRESVRKRLVLAGSPGGMSDGQFIGVRWVTVLAAMALVSISIKSPSVATGAKLMMCVSLPTLVWKCFDFFLSRAIAQRQRGIILGLPDALDVLTVCVDAGLGFDAAVCKVTEKFRGPLIDELSRLMQDVRMGRPRREALKEFGTRSGVDDLNTFATAIIQADQLGVSISNILRTQSEKLRMKRKQRAEEMAMKAPVKMLIPMIILIFPSIFVVLLGPGLIQIIGTMSAR